MSKIQMVSHARHLYNGRPLVSGDSFVVNNETDAQELELLKFASRKPQTYDTRQLVAAPAQGPTAAPDAEVKTDADAVRDAPSADTASAKPKRPYNRRDMAASK